MRLSKTLIFAALALPLTTAQIAHADVSPLKLQEGWFRALPSNLPAGGYFRLHNGGAKAVTLISASSKGCGTLMLHQSLKKGGMSHMEHVHHIEIPAGQELKFEPGSYHLMCMKPTEAMKPGGQIDVTLRFADGQSLTSSFSIRSSTGK